MTCERVRAQLTGYLDGELDSDAGTMVRGHLRTCEACRAIAADEAVLRDGLRQLPPIDPPAALWAGVQARLAAEEVAESQRPAWRRALARWRRFAAPLGTPRVAIAGAVVAAAAIGVIYWKTRPVDEPAPRVVDAPAPRQVTVPPPTFAPAVATPAPAHCTTVADAGDVTADLELDAKRTDLAYDCAIDELLGEAKAVRGEWTDTQRSAFDDQVKLLRDAIAKVGEGRPRQRAARAMIGYLHRAVARDQVLVAGVP